MPQRRRCSHCGGFVEWALDDDTLGVRRVLVGACINCGRRTEPAQPPPRQESRPDNARRRAPRRNGSPP